MAARGFSAGVYNKATTRLRQAAMGLANVTTHSEVILPVGRARLILAVSWRIGPEVRFEEVLRRLKCRN
jgi:hypothetical protein